MNELTMTLTDKEWDVVGNALGQRPFAEVAAIIQKLQMQAQQQRAPQPATPPEVPEN